MKNELNIKIFLATILFIASFVPVSAFASEQGLLGVYSTRWYGNASSYYDEELGKTINLAAKENYFKDARVENVDFWNFTDDLYDEVGRVSHSFVKWKGSLKIEESGEYDFEFQMRSNAGVNFYIDGDCANISSSTGKCAPTSWKSSLTMSKELEAGWHQVEITHSITSVRYDARAVFRMKKSSESKYYQIPKENLSPVFWSDKEIVIGDGTQHLNYFVAGDGAKEESQAEIGVDIPSGVALGDILKDDIIVNWYNYKDCAGCTQITVKNEITGASKNLVGTRLTSLGGQEVDYPQLYARIPASLVDDNGTGKLHFSFRQDPSGSFGAGVGILVPYEDTAQPTGNINLQMVAAGGYHGMSPAFIFELDESQENTISPIFLLADGETRSEYPDKIRPNYIYMAYGKGASPGKTAIVSKMSGAEMVLPKAGSKLFKFGDPKTYFPAFGRDGEQFDIISSKHVPNKVGANNNESKIDEIVIPKGNKWVAFQYYGLNFPGCGSSCGDGESSSITGGGILTVSAATPPSTDRKLTVTVSGSGRVKSVNVPGIDCPGDCEETYSDGQLVKLDPNPDYHNEFSGWTGGGSCDGTNNDPCDITVNADTTVDAAFSYVPGGICSGANGNSSCSEPSFKCYLGTAVNENYDSSTGAWTWQCEKDGYLSGVCSTQKKCDIREVTP